MIELHPSREGHLAKIRAYIDGMPGLSTTVVKVLETCNNPKSSAHDLQRVISLDPVLTGRVLKLINSAYYSLGKPVSSLTRAIIMLGLNTVKNLALSFSVIEALSFCSSAFLRRLVHASSYRSRTSVATSLLSTARRGSPYASVKRRQQI